MAAESQNQAEGDAQAVRAGGKRPWQRPHSRALAFRSNEVAPNARLRRLRSQPAIERADACLTPAQGALLGKLLARKVDHFLATE